MTLEAIIEMIREAFEGREGLARELAETRADLRDTQGALADAREELNDLRWAPLPSDPDPCGFCGISIRAVDPPSYAISPSVVGPDLKTSCSKCAATFEEGRQVGLASYD